MRSCAAWSLRPAAARSAFAREVGNGRLRLTIRDSGVGLAPETGGDGIATIRERLEALYGGNASLDLHRADGNATEAVLDLPLETREFVEERPEGANRRNEARLREANIEGR